MRVDQFDFELPKRCIANFPESPRDHAKLMVLNKMDDSSSDLHFFDLPNILKSGDVIVFNNTRVFPARLIFEFEDKEVEVFLVKKLGVSLWKCMIRPGKLFRLGAKVKFGEFGLEVVNIDSDGFRDILFEFSDDDLTVYVNKFGHLPVPPYIKEGNFKKEDYNTVFANKDGSVAAPTAGLHFTDELLSRLTARGVIIEYVTLQVGLGTFLPIKADFTEFHKMHSETYSIDFDTAKRLNKYKLEKRRVIAVGTTTVRVLEDNFLKFGKILAGEFDTNIFIKPGYEWQMVSGLITNFHLPKSTLLMLVSAFVGKDRVLAAYESAIVKGYRFYSFGDGMLII